MKNISKDTIAAISTPIGFGGIGIVRLSGPESASIARKVFRSSPPNAENQNKTNSGRTFKEIVPRQLHHGYIVDPDNHTIFNEVLMAFMPSPKSYTREDVIEIQGHGGTAALKVILELLVRNGARLADPGEFTRRAYLNGRIDLAQAEATIDVIQAKTEASLRIANRNLGGIVGESVRAIRKGLIEIKALLEARIDFPEDVEEVFDEKELLRKISRNILIPTNAILEGYRHGHLLREGARIVILGRTNVGKSSLLNRFLMRERAIVTSYPGTTRDSIEESINLFGLPAVVVDTAGWRITTDPVEKVGIYRTQDLATTADLVLFMVDGATGIVPEDEDIYLQILEKEKFLIINKADLFEGGPNADIPEHWSFKEQLCTSAKFGHGFEVLKEKIYQSLLNSNNLSEEEVVPNVRQKNLLEKAQQAIGRAMNGLREQIPYELLAIDLQEALEALDEITGDTVNPDILDEIFSRFCIGK